MSYIELRKAYVGKCPYCDMKLFISYTVTEDMEELMKRDKGVENIFLNKEDFKYLKNREIKYHFEKNHPKIEEENINELLFKVRTRNARMGN